MRTPENKPEQVSPSVRQIYERLAAWPNNYEPSPDLNMLYSSIRNYATDPNTSHDLSERESAKLRNIMGIAEYQVEKNIALDTLAEKDPAKTLEHLAPTDRYLRFNRLEKALIDTATTSESQKPWLFMGGGPVPLSAIVFAREHGIRSQVIDVLPEAVDLSSKIVAKLERENLLETGAITIEQADAQTFTGYKNHDVIFVAALAGDTADAKKGIFRQIKQHAPNNALILTRSGRGNRQLVYQPLPKETYEDFELVYELHPHNDIINSMILLKNKPLSSQK